jgi:hypothetical protein
VIFLSKASKPVVAHEFSVNTVKIPERRFIVESGQAFVVR